MKQDSTILFRKLCLLVVTVFFINANINAEEETNIALEADTILTSHVSDWEDLFAINNGIDPESSTDKTGGAYGNWDGSTHEWNWVEYRWDELHVLTRSDVYWWTDGGGIQIPYDTYQEYWDVLENEWVELPNADEFGTERDQYNKTNFTPVLTNRIRVHMLSEEATGILEWRVWGYLGEQIPLESKTTIDQPLEKGSESIVTVTAIEEDQNPVEDYVFKLNVDIVNEVPTIDESYIVNDEVYTESATLIELPQTDENGEVSFNIEIPAEIDPTDGISVQVLYNDALTELGNAYSLYEPGLESPVLTEDDTDNTVDFDIEITFADDPDWREEIQNIMVDGIELVEDTDYEITEGLLTLKPSGENPALIEAGSKEVVIEALGYEDAQVTQEILSGEVSPEYSTPELVEQLFRNVTTNIKLTAADQFGNPVSGYTFIYDVEVIDDDPETNEEYIVAGETISEDIEELETEPTDEDGMVFISITIPEEVDVDDGIDITFMLDDGTPIGNIQYINDSTEKDIVLQSAVENNPDFSWENTAQSENFIIYWGEEIEGHPTDEVNEDLMFDPGEILEMLEDIYIFMTEDLAFIDNPDEGNWSKYKHEVVMNETWTEGFTGWAFGGWVEDGKAGGIWIHPGATRGPGVLVHEFGHASQAMVRSQYPGHGLNAPYAGFFWESHTEWIRAQYTESYDATPIERYINTSMQQFSSNRKYYQNLYFLDYVADTYGIDTTNLIWRKADPEVSHPLTSLRDSVLRYTQSDLNDDFGYYAQRNVTWDYTNGPLIRSAIKATDDKFIGRKYTYVDTLHDGSEAFVVPNYMAPSDYAYNIIPLYPVDDATTIEVDFTGYENEPAGGAGNRYGFVAVDETGEPRYSEIYSEDAGTTSFSINPTDSAIFMVVTGAPETHHNYGWETGFPQEYRYPYSFEIDGALPAGHKEGYNCQRDIVDGEEHSNGGGWVAFTASVEESAYVGPNAQVLGDATVMGNARIEGHAIVEGSASVSGDAVVKDNAIVGTTSQISDNAVVSKSARVYDTSLSDNTIATGYALLYNSSLSNDAKAKDLAWLNNVNLSGTAIVGGNAEGYDNCSSGMYLTITGFGLRDGCDGRINHPLNEDVNPDWEIYHYPLGDKPTSPMNLEAHNVTYSSVDLEWEAAESNIEISEYYIMKDDELHEITNETYASVEGLEDEETFVFTVRAIDLEGNISEKSNEVEVTTPTDIPVTALEDELKIYPNPARQNMTIEFNNEKISYLEVIDVTGKIVYSSNVDNNLITIDKRDIGTGMFFLKLHINDEVITSKIMFQ